MLKTYNGLLTFCQGRGERGGGQRKQQVKQKRGAVRGQKSRFECIRLLDVQEGKADVRLKSVAVEEI